MTPRTFQMPPWLKIKGIVSYSTIIDKIFKNKSRLIRVSATCGDLQRATRTETGINNARNKISTYLSTRYAYAALPTIKPTNGLHYSQRDGSSRRLALPRLDPYLLTQLAYSAR